MSHLAPRISPARHHSAFLSKMAALGLIVCVAGGAACKPRTFNAQVKTERARLVQDGILDRLGTVEAAKGKNVVIYIHGRSSDPSRPEDFVAQGDVWAKKWEAKNWAVYGFLWSKWSFSDSLPPNLPERRVWQNNKGDPKGVGYLAALTIKKEYDSWRAKGFDGELRIVGHSLGSQVASIVANHLVESTDVGSRLRLELIDPYVPDGGFGAGAVEDSAAGNTAEYRAAIRETVKQNLANVAQKANPVVIYAATWVAAYASSLREKAHWQEMDAAWMSQLGSGIVETSTLQHSAIRDAYFDSIEEPVPLTDYGAWAFSAALPTEELRKRPIPIGLRQRDDDLILTRKSLSAAPYKVAWTSPGAEWPPRVSQSTAGAASPSSKACSTYGQTCYYADVSPTAQNDINDELRAMKEKMARNPDAFAADTAARKKGAGTEASSAQKKYDEDIDRELNALKEKVSQGQPPPSSFGRVPPFNQGKVSSIPNLTTSQAVAESEKEILRTSCRPWDSAYFNLAPGTAPVPAFASVKKSCAGMNKETVSLADINSCVFGTQPPTVQPSENYKKCYRFRSKVVHPDLHADAGQPQEYTRLFQLLGKAYASLESFKIR